MFAMDVEGSSSPPAQLGGCLLKFFFCGFMFPVVTTCGSWRFPCTRFLVRAYVCVHLNFVVGIRVHMIFVLGHCTCMYICENIYFCVCVCTFLSVWGGEFLCGSVRWGVSISLCVSYCIHPHPSWVQAIEMSPCPICRASAWILQMRPSPVVCNLTLAEFPWFVSACMPFILHLSLYLSLV